MPQVRHKEGTRKTSTREALYTRTLVGTAQCSPSLNCDVQLVGSMCSFGSKKEPEQDPNLLF